MKASKGDRIVVRGHRVGDPDRWCVVLEAKGPDGGPPFHVKWGDDEHETIFFPGSDARVEHLESTP